jgi:hypothetical protein
MRLFMRLEYEKKSCVKLVKLILPAYLAEQCLAVLLWLFRAPSFYTPEYSFEFY